MPEPAEVHASNAPDARVEVEKAGRRAKRLALAVVLVVSCVFIGQSVWSITPAVFGLRLTPLPASPPGAPKRVCAEGIQRLRRLPSLPGPGDVQPVEHACAQSPEGLDAWAALERLSRAREHVGEAARDDLEPLEQDVAAHLPPDLR